MASSERSLLGFARQTAKGTPNTTDNAFKYTLFTRGSAGVQSQVVPLDDEVGGGAMLRDMVKAGYLSMGQMEFIPRPDSLGIMLMGALGSCQSAPHATETGVYEHTFTLDPDPIDQFSAPYYTARFAPGGMWGEQYQDARFNALALSWRAANFVRGQMSFLGGQASRIASPTWTATAAPDTTPPFITPTATIELPTGTAAKVLSGSFVAGMAIPLDEQWIVGAYLPDDFDITKRTYALQLVLKIADASLYSQMTYDPAGGNAWVASLMREAQFSVNFNGNYPAAGAVDYGLEISGNGQADNAGNVVWSAQPIGLRPGQQVVMAVTGVFLNDNAHAPVTVKLTNKTASYA